MSICAVCGEKVKNVNMKIIRGKSGEWVCRECLNKANINVMKFSYNNIPSGQIMSLINNNSLNQNNQQMDSLNQGSARFCQNCGSRVEGNFCPNCGTAASGVAPQMQNTNNMGMCCPRCKSQNLQIISDVKGKGVSATNLCLCGLLGLAGAGKTKTTHYWVCTKCGNKFKA